MSFSSSAKRYFWWTAVDFAGVESSSLSEKQLKPNASRCFLNRYISEAEAYTENRSLLNFLSGKYIEEEMSRTNWQRKLVSSSKRFTKSLSVLPYSFQSIFLTDSPLLYCRCSANSTEKPWKGLLCKPVINPSTTCLASNSRLPKSCKS